MAYNIKIKVFEGPFDLLFHLIHKNQIDIYDIPITEITDQYILYIEQLEKLNLDNTSEFLVMAATLIEIKSKMLLPIENTTEVQLEIDEVDPRQELVNRLLEYKKYKNIAEDFKIKEKRYHKIFFKPREEFILEDSEKMLDNINIEHLLSSLNKCINKKAKEITPEKTMRHIKRDVVTIEDKTKHILELLEQRNKIQFQDMFLASSSKLDVITSFLALLELIKLNNVVAKQNNIYSNIIIQLKNEET